MLGPVIFSAVTDLIRREVAGMRQVSTRSTGVWSRVWLQTYTQNPQAAEFYAFLKTLETYHKIFTKDSTLVLSTDSEIFALLKPAATKVNGSPIPVETTARSSP
jgi:hypothetical protein